MDLPCFCIEPFAHNLIYYCTGLIFQLFLVKIFVDYDDTPTHRLQCLSVRIRNENALNPANTVRTIISFNYPNVILLSGLFIIITNKQERLSKTEIIVC